jgi:alpha-glucosidase (family GH31 glycosyl hydrolase)
MTDFIESLKSKGRHLVTIIDPHISVNEEYLVGQSLKEKDCLVKHILIESSCEELVDSDTIKVEQVFIGHCWPGASYYADFLNHEKILSIWSKFFKMKTTF